MRSARFLILLVLLSGVCYSQQNVKRYNGLVVLSSADVSNDLSADRLHSCLRQMARDWNVDGDAIPNIFVLNVSKKVARMAAISSGNVEVRRNLSTNGSQYYYEVWLVGSPSIDEYILALENIVEDNFQLHPTDEQRRSVMVRAARLQHATVNAFRSK